MSTDTTWADITQAGAGYGMALLAAYNCGAVFSLEGISQNAVSVKERFLPRPRHVDL